MGWSTTMNDARFIGICIDGIIRLFDEIPENTRNQKFIYDITENDVIRYIHVPTEIKNFLDSITTTDTVVITKEMLDSLEINDEYDRRLINQHKLMNDIYRERFDYRPDVREVLSVTYENAIIVIYLIHLSLLIDVHINEKYYGTELYHIRKERLSHYIENTNSYITKHILIALRNLTYVQ